MILHRLYSPSAISILKSLGLMALIGLWGCSLNHYGIPGTVIRHEVMAEYGKKVVVEAYGIHLYTDPNPGIQLGVREAELIYPVVCTSFDPKRYQSCLKSLGPSSIKNCCSDSTDKTKQTADQIIYHTIPIQINTQRVGIGLDISPYALSGSIGLSRKRVVRAKSKDSFIFYYNNTNGTVPNEYGTVIIRNKGD